MIPSLATRISRDTLTRGLWASVAIAALIIGCLGIQTVLAWRFAGRLNAENTHLEKQLSLAGSQTTAAEGGPTLPRGLATLRVLQDAVTQATGKNKCQLIEFKAGTTVSAYSPRYRKDIPPGSWSQMDAHFTLTGRLRDVIESLRSLGTLNLPVEIDSIGLTRETISLDGSALINAQVQLRAISRGSAS